MNFDLDQRLRFFLAIVIIVFVALAGCFAFFSDVYFRLAIVLLSPVALFLGFRIASPGEVSENKLRLTIVTTLGTGLFGYLHLRQHFAESIKQKLQPLSSSISDATGVTVPPEFIFSNISFDAVSIVLIIATATIFYWILRPARTGPAMGRPQASLADVLPNVTNLQRLEILKHTLKDRLDQLDYATRWNEANFVALEAEVQILEGQTSRRKVVDLLKALSLNQRTRLFVVLGEPGTGKSVALRQLCRDLLKNSRDSDRIPLYVNLKEWRANREWTVTDRPNVKDFHNFVFNNLRQSLDFNSQSFLNEANYKAMLEAGYFFFVLDSFDEIPAVLDHEENSWLIEALSTSIATYVLGGRNSRGVVASRLFRKPKIVQKERSVFEILPFSDDRIVRAIKAASENPDRLARIILTERPDLGSIARNPFLLHLIISHFNQTGSAPLSQAEMFQTFIQANITQAKQAFGLPGISTDEVYDICEGIATAMFNKPLVGLEIGLSDLRAALSVPQLPHILEFLAQARIGRVAPTSNAFSFSHRRFNEYFLVRRLQAPYIAIPLEAIQSDSRWRDALVLYAEIAEPSRATLMASHAWQYAQQLEHLTLGSDREGFIASRHALRFLVEGFRNKLEIVAAYRSSITRIISNKLASDSDYIEKRTVLEALGLLPAEQATTIIRKALRDHPGWISEQASRAARYLPRLSPKLAYAIYDYVTRRTGLDSIKQAQRQARIFEISDTFQNISNWLKWYVLDFWKTTFALLLICVFATVAESSSYFRNIASAIIMLAIFYFVGVISEIFGLRFRFSFILNLANFPRLALALIAANATIQLVVQHVHLAPFSLFGELNTDKPAPTNVSLSAGASLIAFCVLALVPVKPAFWLRWQSQLSKQRNLLGALLGQLIAMAAIGMFLSFLTESWRRYILIAFIAITAAAGIPLYLWFLLKGIATLIRERKRLTTVSNSFSPSRGIIAEQFLSFETTYGRRRYLDWLERASSNSAKILRDPSNIWPSGKRPQLAADEASVRLAQLDARWLDID
jgi:glycosyltransferase involved in cell wall biosynthesis